MIRRCDEWAARDGGPRWHQLGDAGLLRAVRDFGTVEVDRVVVRMRKALIADPLFGTVTIRTDCRAVHDLTLSELRRPGRDGAI